MDITKEALEILISYQWPGNVRELENVVQKILISTRNNHICTENIPNEIIENSKILSPSRIFALRTGDENIKLKDVLNDYEKKIIEEVYNNNNKKQRKTAQALGITLRGLQLKLIKLGIK